MAELVYLTNTSLDGYIEDRHGSFDLGAPDDDVFVTCTELLQGAGTVLYGRRLYETMAVWETDPALAERSALAADFADAWKALRKVVYSTSLATAATANTQIERSFDAAAVRRIKAEASRDLVIGGADLAGQGLAAGLVDQCVLLVWPVVLGGGKPALPAEDRIGLELLDLRRFDNGVLLLRYRPRLR